MMSSREGISISEPMSSSNIRYGEGDFRRLALIVVSVLALCQLAGRSFVGKAVDHPTSSIHNSLPVRSS